MVPEEHEIVVPSHPQLTAFFTTSEFQREVFSKLQTQYEVDLIIRGKDPSEPSDDEEHLVLAYTRNNAGGLKDAIEFLVNRLVPHGLDATTVKGAIARPKSDTFEETLPFFESKLLQRTQPSNSSTDSPTRSTFGDDVSERGSLFDKIRKPGSISSLSSFLERRKNQSSSSTSLFKHASSNASKASLVSMESRDSGYRNPWNDSGINLATDDTETFGANGWPIRFSGSGHHLNGTSSAHDLKKPTSSSSASSPFGFGNSSSSLSTGMPGDSTPRHGELPQPSFDSGRPATSHSYTATASSGTLADRYPPGPIGPPR